MNEQGNSFGARKRGIAMCKNVLFVLVSLLSFVGIGCGSDSSDGPFGREIDSPLLRPFAGQWTFDFEKTLAAQKAAGVADEQIAQLRKLHTDNPQLGKMHPDLAVKGNVAVGRGLPRASAHKWER